MELVTLDLHAMNSFVPSFIILSAFTVLMCFFKIVDGLERAKGEKRLPVLGMVYLSLMGTVFATTIIGMIVAMVHTFGVSHVSAHNKAVLEDNGFEILQPTGRFSPYLGKTSTVNLEYNGKYYHCKITSPDEPGVLSVSCGDNGLSLEDIVRSK